MIAPEKADLNKGYKENPPDLHEAAAKNDVAMMHECLARGQSFDRARGDNKLTPMHIAAICKSHDFIRAAIETKLVNLWIRDGNLRLPFDISSAFKDHEAMKVMFDWMYEGPFGPKPDAEVAEFPSQGL